MDKNIAMIFDAKGLLESSHAEDYPLIALGILYALHGKVYISGKTICVDRNDKYIYRKTQVDLLYFIYADGDLAEELIVRSNDKVVFSAEGHTVDDYKTTFYIHDSVWETDLSILCFTVRD